VIETVNGYLVDGFDLFVSGSNRRYRQILHLHCRPLSVFQKSATVSVRDSAYEFIHGN
jgi:hypothetical protein